MGDEEIEIANGILTKLIAGNKMFILCCYPHF